MRRSKIVSTAQTGAMCHGYTVVRLEPAGDRTTGISAAQAALAATDNVLKGSVSPVRLAAMAANFIEALGGDKPNRLRGSVDRITGRIRLDHFESGFYQPHRTIKANICHQTYIDHLLSPSGHETLRQTLSTTIALNFSGIHAGGLDALRTFSRQTYDLIIRGNFRAALVSALNGKTGKQEAAVITGIVRNHARCFAIMTAHQKVAVLQVHATAPYGDRFAGFKRWPSVGHICLATIAAPAQIIQSLAAEAAAGGFDNLDDAAVFEKLTQKGWLRSAAGGSAVIDIAQVVRRTLESRRQGRGSYDFTAALNYVAHSCALGAQLNRGAIRRDSLSKLEPAEFRLGLSGSEGAAFVALEVLRAFMQIDACVDAILANEPLPAPAPVPVAKKPLAFTSVLLRSEGQPDRNATKIDPNPDTVWHDLDKRRGSGRIPVVSMLEKLKDPAIQNQAQESLGIDARHWFQC